MDSWIRFQSLYIYIRILHINHKILAGSICNIIIRQDTRWSSKDLRCGLSPRCCEAHARASCTNSRWEDLLNLLMNKGICTCMYQGADWSDILYIGWKIKLMILFRLCSTTQTNPKQDRVDGPPTQTGQGSGLSIAPKIGAEMPHCYPAPPCKQHTENKGQMLWGPYSKTN